MDQSQRRPRSRLVALWGAAGLALLVPTFAGRALAGPTAIALTGDGRLLQFDSDAPGTIQRSTSVTGLNGGETLLGIDFRPATPNQLYGLGSFGQLYRVDAASGAATKVGPELSPDQLPLEGESFGFDFNPVPDRIRGVSDLGENFRLHPDTGALAATDGALTYAAGDQLAGQPAGVTAVAYTNSTAGATTTTLYGIDSAFGVLVVQDPPNDGTLRTVGSLGVDEATLIAGFDILSDGTGDQAFAASTGEPPDFGAPLPATLYRIDLTTGAATAGGTIGDGTLDIRGLAVTANAGPTPIPIPSALLAFPLGAAVAGFCHHRMRRRERDA